MIDKDMFINAKKLIKKKSTNINNKIRSELKNNNSVSRLLPYTEYREDYIQYKKELVSIFEIKGRDLFNIDEDEKNYIINQFFIFYKTLKINQSIKLICLNYPINLNDEKEYINYLLNKGNEKHKEFLEMELNNINLLEEKNNKGFFVYIIGENEEDLTTKKEQLISTLGMSFNLKLLNESQTINLLYKLNNMNSGYKHSFKRNTKDLKLNLRGQTTPQGGVKFEIDHIKKGDGYEACVHINELPSSVEQNWLYKLFNFNDVVTIVDITSPDKDEIIPKINNSLKEHVDRYNSESNPTDIMKAENDVGELNNLFKNISNNGETINYVSIRIYVFERTYKELEKKVNDVITRLDGMKYKASILLGEQREDFNNIHEIDKKNFIDIPSSALAIGLGFHFTNLENRNGMYMGYTSTSGYVHFDPFHADGESRLSFNGIIVGTMGQGKSTILKLITEQETIKGNNVRVMDVSGEFKTLVNRLGGAYIEIGGENTINPLEVLKSHEDEIINFSHHLTKVSNFYKFIAPDSNSQTVKLFENTLREMYSEKYPNCMTYGLEHSLYPIFSDLYDYILEKYEKSRVEKSSDEIIFNKIKTDINNLVFNYEIFNKKTTVTLENSLVCFGLKGITEMNSEIYNAQINSIINLCSQDLIISGEKQKEKYEKYEKDLRKIKKTMIIIDEAHRVINSKNEKFIEAITLTLRESRKYFGGVIFATQSIRDFFPEFKDGNEISESMKNMFELLSYYFIGKQYSSARYLLKKIFNEKISESELMAISRQKRSEFLLLAGESNINLKVEVNNELLELFKGGV